MQFEFTTAGRIIFGEGAFAGLASAVSSWGRRAFFVVGRSEERAAGAIQALRSSGIHVEVFHVPAEPDVELILEGLHEARASRIDMVIAVGGGSALDAGKAIAALLTNPGEVGDYLEVIGQAKTLEVPPLPYAAVPTTAGTGTEVTRNAVLTITGHGVKVSLRGPALVPRLAIVDPTLTLNLPRQVTAASGMDALAQLIEPFVSKAANPFTDALCREGIQRVAGAIRRVYADGSDRPARADMSLGALLSGMALANAKLGAVHGFAGPLGGLLRAPHGAICARLLPPVVKANLRALRQREPTSSSLRRFDELAELLTGDQEAAAEDAANLLADLCAYLQIPPLRTYSLMSASFPEIVARAKQSSSMRGNPVALTDPELTRILEEAL